MKADRRKSKPVDDAGKKFIRNCLSQAFKLYEIAQKMNRPVSDIRRATKEMGIVCSNEYHKKPLPGELSERIPLINSSDEMFGKSNPFSAVLEHMELRKHFEDNNGVRYYKGKKLATFQDWTPAIRDLNRLRRNAGFPQFDYVADWII
jgi:hypothetical protein